jgi:phosphate:Na+ symporter
MRPLLPAPAGPGALPDLLGAAETQEFLIATRERCVTLGADLPWEERGAVLELLGSAERAFFLIARIDAERRSVPRMVPAREEAGAPLGNPGLAPA